MHNIRWTDFLLPWPAAVTTPNSAVEKNRQRINSFKALLEEAVYLDETELQDLLDTIKQMGKGEDDRRVSVDSRLSAIVGLTSIAATIVIGIIVSQAAGHLTFGSSSIYAFIALVSFYLIVQLCNSIGWAIKGQSSGEYKVDSFEDLVRSPKQSAKSWLCQRIAHKVHQYVENASQTDRKFTDMEVAHRSMINFILGLVVLGLIGTIAALM